MPPTPITATHRLVMKYHIDGFDHKSQNWCGAVPSGDSTGFDITTRSGFIATGMSVVVDRFHSLLAPALNPAVDAPGLAILYDYTAPAFPIPIASYATSVVYTGSGGTNFAYGFVVFIRSTTFEKMPFPLFELGFGIQSFKNNSYAGLLSGIKPFVNYATNAGGTATPADAYAWRRSRSAKFAQNYVSGTWDTNEKLRRKRGIK